MAGSRVECCCVESQDQGARLASRTLEVVSKSPPHPSRERIELGFIRDELGEAGLFCAGRVGGQLAGWCTQGLHSTNETASNGNVRSIRTD